jgi:hypothetical protein
MRRIFGPAEQFLVPQEELSFTELVTEIFTEQLKGF